MIKAIVVDDEKTSRDTMQLLLKLYCPDVEVVHYADGCKSGIEAIDKYKPDLVFLDVQMPDGSGFKVLEHFSTPEFKVVFTTAYDQYAIKAIKHSAIDYLLKPIDPNELVESVKRFNKTPLSENQVQSFIENLKNIDEEADTSLVLHTSEGMHIVKLNQIIRCQSDNYYTKFFLTNEKVYMVSKTLKENEELLNYDTFVRVHKSHLINIKHIQSYMRNNLSYLLMSDNSRIPVSRRKREIVLKLINNLP